MLTRLIYALIYCAVIGIVCYVLIWLAGLVGLPAMVGTLILVIGVLLGLVVLLGVLTGRIAWPPSPPGTPPGPVI